MANNISNPSHRLWFETHQPSSSRSLEQLFQGSWQLEWNLLHLAAERVHLGSAVFPAQRRASIWIATAVARSVSSAAKVSNTPVERWVEACTHPVLKWIRRQGIKKNSLSLSSLKPSGKVGDLDLKTPTAAAMTTYRTASDPKPSRAPRRGTSISGYSVSGSSMTGSSHPSLDSDVEDEGISPIKELRGLNMSSFYVFSDSDRPAAWQLWQNVQDVYEKRKCEPFLDIST